MKKISNKTMARVLCLVLVAAMLLPFVSCMSREETELAIIYSGGVSGRIEADKNVIGAASVASYAAAVREKFGGNALLVDSGGFVYGSPLVNLTQGALPISLLAALGYDACNLGSSDLGYGADRLMALSKESAVPMLSCNLKWSGKEVFSPYVIKKIGRVRVGIIGAVTDDLASYRKEKMGVLSPEPMAESVRRTVDEVKSKADVIVLLSSIGGEDAKALAESVKKIDVIIDAESGGDIADGTVVGNTIICRPAAGGEKIGLLQLKLKGKSVFEASSSLVTVDALSKLTPDAEITKILEGAKAESSAYLNEPIGKSTTVLDGEKTDVRKVETNFGNFTAAFALVKAQADAAIIHSASIRASIPAGEITRGNVQAALPLDNYLVRYTLSGEQLWQTLEYALSDYEVEGGLFPQIAGMSIRAKVSNPVGSRLMSVMVGGTALVPSASYKLAVLSGGDMESVSKLQNPLAKLKPDAESGLFSDLVIDYIKQVPEVSAVTDGRIELS